MDMHTNDEEHVQMMSADYVSSNESVMQHCNIVLQLGVMCLVRNEDDDYS